MTSERHKFSSTTFVKTLLGASAGLFTCMAVLSTIAAIRAPSDKNPWWVPMLFAGGVVLAAFGYPGTIITDQVGIVSESWYCRRSIRWPEVQRIELNTARGRTRVISHDGKNIMHLEYHKDAWTFRYEVLRRTHLPLTVIVPGIWKPKTEVIPNHEAIEMYAPD